MEDESGRIRAGEAFAERHSSLNWKSLLFVTALVMAVAIVVGVVALQFWPKSEPRSQVVRPGEIIDSFGEYQSFSGRIQFSVGSGDGPGKCFWKASTEEGTSRMEFAATEDWFATIDEVDHVWVFTSSRGVIFWEMTKSANRTATVGGDYWRGVPPSFVERLPETYRKDYEEWATQAGMSPIE